MTRRRRLRYWPILLLTSCAAAALADEHGAAAGGPQILGDTETGQRSGAWRVSVGSTGELRWMLERDAAMTEQSISVVLDEAGPDIRIRWEGPHIDRNDATVVGPDARPIVAATDPAGAEIVSYGWADDAVSTTGFPSPLPESTTELAVVAIDGLDHENRRRIPVVVDRQGPVIHAELTSMLPSAPGYSARPARLRAWAEDAQTGARIVGPRAGRAERPEEALEITTEEASVLVVAEDELGNRSEQRLNWRYDEAPPTVALQHGGESYTPGDRLRLRTGENVLFEVADAGVGVASATYHYNNLPTRPVPRSLRFLDPGRYRVLVNVADREGNAATYRWVVLVR